MSDFIIKVENLTKTFKLYSQPKDRLKEALSPFRKKYHHEFHALKNISFEIKRGQSVGILGKNGAGKSTLLKILTGVLTPTSGNVTVNGRISALLELGSGFNPELSGMENIYFQGAIIGFTKEEMAKKIPEIIDFADIGEFIHQPVKTYSSGMFARLAFSIAINVEPDILIVDEALSVGDMSFQAKCMNKMQQMMSQGITLFFVSHDSAAIKALCQISILLENGQLAEIGPSSIVASHYIGNMHLEINNSLKEKLKNLQATINNGERTNIPEVSLLSISDISVSTDIEPIWSKSTHRFGQGEAKIIDVKLLSSSREVVNEIIEGEDFFIQVSVKFSENFPRFCLLYTLSDLKAQQLLGGMMVSDFLGLDQVKKGDLFVVEIASKNILKNGAYTLSIAIEIPIELNIQHAFLDVLEHAVVFKSIIAPDPLNRTHSLVRNFAKFKISQSLTPTI